MSPDKLVHMANQIATFFAVPSRRTRRVGRRRRAYQRLLGAADARASSSPLIEAGGAGLHPLVLEAAPQMRPVQAA